MWNTIAHKYWDNWISEYQLLEYMNVVAHDYGDIYKLEHTIIWTYEYWNTQLLWYMIYESGICDYIFIIHIL